MQRQSLWTACAIFLALFIEIRGEGPPQYGYDNLPITRFTCEGKLQGRYYADPDTDCQLFHVCVKMSKRETQDFKFLCPNGTVFDQEHLVCADYYQVACNSNYQSTSFGHIFEFLKLSASKDKALDFGKVPTRDPEYLGKNTLSNDDFQAEEYNNNKLAASGNSLPYTQNLKPKEIKFPTTTTRRTTPTPATTTRITTTTRQPTTAVPVTTTQNYYQGQQQGQGLVSQVPSESDSYNAGLQSTTYQNNLNFHRETDVPQSFPTTTTQRPEYFQETTNNNFNNNNNYNNNNNNFAGNTYSNNNNNNFGINKDYTTTTTYAPQRYEESTTTRRPFFQYQTNPTTTYNFRETFAPSTPFPTTTRRPFFQNTFRTSLDAVTTQSPIVSQPQSQSTYQQQPSRFSGDNFFQRIPTTEQSTTIRTQNLFFGGNAQTTYSPIDYYTTAQSSQYYIPQGRSINSQGVQPQSFLKTDRPKQFATKTATAATESYSVESVSTTSAPIISYYEPTKAPTTAAQPQQSSSQIFTEEKKVDETPVETTETPTTSTTTLRPRRGGRRRLNPNRQRQQQQQQQQQQGGQPRNFDPQFKYSRRVQSTRESFAVKQKTEEIFNAEASVFRGQPKTNTFYIDDKRQPKEQDAPVDVPLPPPQRRPAFGGEGFGRRIRPGKQVIVQSDEVKPTISEPEVNSRPERTRVVKRLRQKTTSTTTTTTENSLPAETSSSSSSTQFAHTTLRPARVSVRTKLAGGIPANADIIHLKGENGSTRRRVIIKTYRPKSTSSSTEEPQLITAPIIQFEKERVETPVAASTTAATLVTESNADDSKSTASFTTFKVEEITYKPEAITTPTKNITSTVGGFKVTTVISHSSDESQPQQIKSISVKPQFPKLNKKFLVKNEKSDKSSTSLSSSEDGQVGSTQSPDYDYSYYNTDDESQYVAEQNSQDRLFGKKARRPIPVILS